MGYPPGDRGPFLNQGHRRSNSRTNEKQACHRAERGLTEARALPAGRAGLSPCASAKGSGAGTSRPQRALEPAVPHASALSWTVAVTAHTQNLVISPQNRHGDRQYNILLSFLSQAFENPGLPHLAPCEALGICREELGGTDASAASKDRLQPPKKTELRRTLQARTLH